MLGNQSKDSNAACRTTGELGTSAIDVCIVFKFLLYNNIKYLGLMGNLCAVPFCQQELLCIKLYVGLPI